MAMSNKYHNHASWHHTSIALTCKWAALGAFPMKIYRHSLNVFNISENLMKPKEILGNSQWRRSNASAFAHNPDECRTLSDSEFDKFEILPPTAIRGIAVFRLHFIEILYELASHFLPIKFNNKRIANNNYLTLETPNSMYEQKTCCKFPR